MQSILLHRLTLFFGGNIMASSKKTKMPYRNTGAAMIILLIIIVLGVTVFALQKAGVLKRRPADPNTVGILPWDEWKARQALEVEAGEIVIDPNEIGWTIGESLAFKGNLRYSEEKDGRGRILIIFGPGGVRGGWSGSYRNAAGKLVDVQGGSAFSGRFYRDHTADIDGNEDPAKHYFLCKGEFNLMETGEQYVKFRAGDMYVRGWLDENTKNANGTVFVTSNEKDFYEYDFAGGTILASRLQFD